MQGWGCGKAGTRQSAASLQKGSGEAQAKRAQLAGHAGPPSAKASQEAARFLEARFHLFPPRQLLLLLLWLCFAGWRGSCA